MRKILAAAITFALAMGVGASVSWGQVASEATWEATWEGLDSAPATWE